MSDRILKVNELIKTELSRILYKELDFSRDILITITRVDCSSDLNNARVYVSIIPEIKEEKTFDILNKKIQQIQKSLDKRLIMRFVPKIIFKKEKETKNAQRIEEILEEIKSNEKS